MCQGPSHINQTFKTRSNASALCGGCHLASHETFDSKRPATPSRTRRSITQDSRRQDLCRLYSAMRVSPPESSELTSATAFRLERSSPVAAPMKEEKDSENGPHQLSARFQKIDRKRRQKGEGKGKQKEKTASLRTGKNPGSRWSSSCACATNCRNAPLKDAASFLLPRPSTRRLHIPQGDHMSSLLTPSLYLGTAPGSQTVTGCRGAIARDSSRR